MQFELRIDYRSPSQERLFLGSGWGLRDVRGVYLNASEGRICISPWALSPVKPSVISLQFGMSNRAILQAVSLQAAGDFGVKSCFLERNKASKLLVEDVVGHEQREYIIRIMHPRVPRSGDSRAGLIDFISVDGLELSR
jgi:hypothetical protein